MARLADHSLLTTDEEVRLLVEGLPELGDRVVSVQNGVDAGYFDPEHGGVNPYPPGGPVLVFTGVMDYWPNVDAVTWFVEEILPGLRQSHPEVRFCIVGMNPTAEVRALARQPGVIVTGRVEDVRPWIAHAALAVAPLRIARGVQNKVLEAMAMTKAVVVTPAAAKGLSGRAGLHRGPDEGSLHIEPGLGFGHRRLSIIDIATGQQPLANEDDTVWVVFNGEIYNFQELVPELEAAGHRFKTRSDTEVIVHAWEQWGEACVQRFRGMFAFVLWDRRRQTLFMARDRLGVKPLYWSLLDDGTLLFGSELKSLLAYTGPNGTGLKRAIDPLALEEYFALGYVAEPRTIFRQAHKLPPGHMLAIRRGEPVGQPREYWDVHFTGGNPSSVADASAELVERLRESVRLRMISEVPLGAFLSGGVDSSAVVQAMAGLSAEPVNTCSIAFDDPQFNESAFAQQVADRYATRHRVETVKADDFDLIDTLARLYDEPYADSSAIPTYRVCQLARKHVTVALSGDGGDENFGGYRRYRLHLMEEKLRAALPAGIRQPLFGLLGRIYPKADWAPRMFRAKTTFEGMARDAVQAYCHSVSILRAPMRARLFSPALQRELGGYAVDEVFQRHARHAETDDPLALIQYLDLKTYLVGDINTKVDRASMAHSLEVREPLMDHPLVEWLATLPAGMKIRGNEGKFLLKKAMEPHLPNEVLYRPKMGFSVPLARWFRGPLKQRVREAVLGDRLAATGWFNRPYLEHLVDAHQAGTSDYSAPLWTLLMVEAFLRSKVVLGFVGFVREWHGLDRILDWMATSQAAGDVTFVVIGEGQARLALEAQAEALGLKDKVSFVGFIGREHIPAWVAAFDVALQPAAVPYASPLKLFEYLMLGCAVVAPAQENLKEILIDGVNARLFDPEDRASLFQALNELVVDADLRHRLGNGARRTIVDGDFTWRSNAKRVARRFDELLSGDQPGTS
jgi:asparagine synthase (glutamine-hydrolysing)